MVQQVRITLEEIAVVLEKRPDVFVGEGCSARTATVVARDGCGARLIFAG